MDEEILNAIIIIGLVAVFALATGFVLCLVLLSHVINRKTKPKKPIRQYRE